MGYARRETASTATPGMDALQRVRGETTGVQKAQRRNEMAAMSAMGLREIRRDRGPRPFADRTSELQMLEAYRERLLTELMEVEREINAINR